MTGWISIRRGALEHELLAPEGKFSRFEAWVWLIEHAAFKATAIDLHGTRLVVPRGSLCYSLRALADSWGWSVKAVRTFLAKLELHGSVACSADQKGHSRGTTRTIITICNYEKYQTPPAQSGTAGAQQGHTKEQGSTLPYGRDASASAPSDADLFRYGREILGRSAGGFIAKLKAQFGIPKAFALLQQAAEKADPAEWLGAALKAKPDAADLKLETWGIGDAKPVRVEPGTWHRDAEASSGAADLSGMQFGPEGSKPEGPVSFGDANGGWSRDLLPPLRLVAGGAV